MVSTFYRKLQTLRLLKKFPEKVCTTELLSQLKALGFSIEIRQLQRDLNSLAQVFEIENDGNKDIPGWYWKADAEKLELPQMELPVALSFQLAQKHLSELFPQGILQHLTPYFKLANKLLDNTETKLSGWSNKIRHLSRRQPLIPPVVSESIIHGAYLALLSDTQINALYRPVLKDAKHYQLVPKAIVAIEQIFYLVAENLATNNIQQFALHRFDQIENTDIEITDESFDLDTYLQQGNLLYPYHSAHEISLKLQVSERVAFYLNEMRLSENQTITPLEEDDEYIVTATVQNTEQLRWWLQSYSFYIEVLEPESLREEFAEAAEILNEIYNP